MAAPVVMHVAIALDQLAPADIERYYAALRAAEAVGTMAARAGHRACREQCSLVADHGHYLVATGTRAFEIDLLAANLGFAELCRSR
jgi:hypothetical protein